MTEGPTYAIYVDLNVDKVNMSGRVTRIAHKRTRIRRMFILSKNAAHEFSIARNAANVAQVYLVCAFDIK